MQLGMIGLGRMSANIVRRLINNGHQCVVYDRSQQAVDAALRAVLGPGPRFVQPLLCRIKRVKQFPDRMRCFSGRCKRSVPGSWVLLR
jgi:6-phosphogluconate dehydrogenase (decarboxylating)